MIIEDGLDAGAFWHTSDPMNEQAKLASGQAAFDLGYRPAFAVSGPERFTWLNDISTQRFVTGQGSWKTPGFGKTPEGQGLTPGEEVSSLILDGNGHILHVFTGFDDGETFHAFTEPGRRDALLEHLKKMKFLTKVSIDVEERYPKALRTFADGQEQAAEPGLEQAGIWAYEALRIEAGIPRIFVDTDDKTLPNEIAQPHDNRLGRFVHLKKGCYPGNETVQKVYNRGRPPRRLTLLYIDGSEERLPQLGADVTLDGVVVGRMGSSERHYELGPIGLALVKRNTPLDATLVVDGLAANQEPIVDPEVGRHVRATATVPLKGKQLL
ncbi:MAG: folate-binding protein [Propionibacteriaceae bacterium]|jgi:folate-binding protein YgfZ|nr:folate-binding protein [Propionibacteriaceae bacterium]